MSSPLTTAIFRSMFAAEQTDFKAAAQASGFTPPALHSTLIPENQTVRFKDKFLFERYDIFLNVVNMYICTIE